MVDIAKCSGEDCHIRETCYRYTAIPDPDYQSMFTPPLHDGVCDMYWHRCKHVHKSGESCNLNNSCKFPDCDMDGPLKPIHKFNDGLGATLCYHCGIIILPKQVSDLFCDICRKNRDEMLNQLK